MQAQLQRIEIKLILVHDDDLPIENAARRQRGTERIQQLRKVAVQRLFVAALDQNLIPVPKYQRTKSIPLGLENVLIAGG